MSAPPRTSLLHCPDVLLQLMARMLPRCNIILMARCCHQLLHALSSPAAFQLTSLQLRSANLKPRSPGLLRFAPVSLQISSPTRAQQVWPDAPLAPSNRPQSSRPVIEFWTRAGLDAVLAHAAHIVRLEFAWTSSALLSTSLWLHLLAHPSLRSLESLIIHRGATSARSRCAITPQMMQLICALPRLRSLSVHPDAADPARWSALSEARLLTDLHIADSNCNDLPSLLPAVVKFAAPLRSLSILLPKLSMDQFCSVFTQVSPTSQSLQHLTIEQWDVEHCPKDSSLSRAFLALSSLVSLKLLKIRGIERVLASLQHSASLRELLLRPVFEHGGVSADAIGRLLIASPLLTATVFVGQRLYQQQAIHNSTATTEDLRGWKARQTDEVAQRMRLNWESYDY